jgi:hypothetical protein
MKYYSVLFLLLIFNLSCSVSADEKESQKVIEKPRAENECPKGNHTDSIIPLIYGFPTEEDFRKSDSGLVALGGCELPENPDNYYCKKHKITFK